MFVLKKAIYQSMLLPQAGIIKEKLWILLRKKNRFSHSNSHVNHICQQIFYKVIVDVGTPSGCLIRVRLLLFKKGGVVKENNLDEVDHCLL